MDLHFLGVQTLTEEETHWSDYDETAAASVADLERRSDQHSGTLSCFLTVDTAFGAL